MANRRAHAISLFKQAVRAANGPSSAPILPDPSTCTVSTGVWTIKNAASQVIGSVAVDDVVTITAPV